MTLFHALIAVRAGSVTSLIRHTHWLLNTTMNSRESKGKCVAVVPEHCNYPC
jgi:hypothetical protein